MVRVLVMVYSRFGVLQRLADDIVEGAQKVPQVQVHVLPIDDVPIDELRPGETEDDRARRRTVLVDRLSTADALIVGAPAYFGTMASPMKRLFEDCLTAASPPPNDRSRPWHLALLRDKVGAAFTASGTPHGGNEMALHSILTMFMHLGMVVVTPGQAEPLLKNPAAPYGATAIAGASADRPLSEEEGTAAQALGERVARIAVWLCRGRSEWERSQINRA